ncbi:MAG: hypothetical protein SF029_10025 [bacterium]|nr:hypothetical protein [bacterium]
MDSTAYQTFTDALIAQAAADPAVIGLVALGSMADLSRRDNWSDHDFFWIVEGGQQERYRTNLDWLPRADEIVLHFREGAHGLKVMYGDGHLIEFAVFDLAELAYARVNDYAVLLDQGDITAHMAQIERTSQPATINLSSELIETLCLIQVGSGRAARGEVISGSVFIKTYVVLHLLRVITATFPGQHTAVLDSLDPYRRFERAFPQFAPALHAALLLPPLECALALLEFIEREIRPHTADFPQAGFETVRGYVLRCLKANN